MRANVEAETPMPEVKGWCQICFFNYTKKQLPPQLVSPSGLVHEGSEGGMTSCGRDATGDKWWWAL